MVGGVLGQSLGTAVHHVALEVKSELELATTLLLKMMVLTVLVYHKKLQPVL